MINVLNMLHPVKEDQSVLRERRKEAVYHVFQSKGASNLVPRAMPVRGLGLALVLGKRNEIRNFIGCREINNLGAA